MRGFTRTCLRCGDPVPFPRTRFCTNACRDAHNADRRVLTLVAPEIAGDAPVVLGLDLASRTVGWAVTEGGEFRRSGTFRLPDTARKGESRAHLGKRKAVELYQRLSDLVREFHPRLVAYEYPDRPRHRAWRGARRVTPGTEFNAARALGNVEGILWTLWAYVPLHIMEVVPIRVEEAKLAACGDPNAAKAKVARALRDRFGVDVDRMTEDETDAWSVALAASVVHAEARW